MGLNGKSVRSDKYQHNPGTAPATVSELQQISRPLRFDAGRRSASLTTTRESGDRPEGVKSRPRITGGNSHSL